VRVKTKNDQWVPESSDFGRTSVRHNVRVLSRLQVPGCAERAYPVQGGDMPAWLPGSLSDRRTYIGRTFTSAAATAAPPPPPSHVERQERLARPVDGIGDAGTVAPSAAFAAAARVPVASVSTGGRRARRRRAAADAAATAT